uniref:Bryoporin-like n=1 Tax=Acanthochromis polyacanthus TaxID=80966 RepID=A0A3Q1EUM1_9TELE
MLKQLLLCKLFYLWSMIYASEGFASCFIVLTGGAATMSDHETAEDRPFISTHRQCSFTITNMSSQYTLSEPSHYTISGRCDEKLPLLVPPCSSGDAKFVKTANSARGAVGVFTYTLHNQYTKRTTGKMAVMFSVPFDYSLYFNWYGLGIFDKSTECNKELFDLMYDNKIVSTFSTGKASGPSLTYKKDQVTITASMSDQSKSVIKVLVKDNWN